MFENPGRDERCALLARVKTIAVVGLSADWFRPSYFAAKYMMDHGYTVIPVNPRAAGTEILGEQTYADLATTQLLLGRVIDREGLGADVEDLRHRVKASAPSGPASMLTLPVPTDCPSMKVSTSMASTSRQLAISARSATKVSVLLWAFEFSSSR